MRLFRPAVSYELNTNEFQNMNYSFGVLFSPSSRVKTKTMESEDTFSEKSIIFKRCRWWWLCYRGWNCGVNSTQRIKENEWNELQAWKNVEITNRGDKICDWSRCFHVKILSHFSMRVYEYVLWGLLVGKKMFYSWVEEQFYL